MSDILKRILATKFDEVSKASAQIPMHTVRSDAEASLSDLTHQPRGFIASIEKKLQLVMRVSLLKSKKPVLVKGFLEKILILPRLLNLTKLMAPPAYLF